MPFKAAKALAATFCYEIRYALTPIFGTDFLAMCTHPKDPNFGKFLIDPAIVRDCTEETHRWRIEGEAYRPEGPMAQSIPAAPERPPMVPGTPRSGFAYLPWGSRSVEVVDQESGYGTDDNEKCLPSPEFSPRSTGWTPINQPKPDPHLRFNSSQRWLTSVPGSSTGADLHKKRDISRITPPEEDEGFMLSAITPTTIPAEETVEYVKEDGDDWCSTNEGLRHGEDEINVAKILISLRDAGETTHRSKRIRRGSIF